MNGSQLRTQQNFFTADRSAQSKLQSQLVADNRIVHSSYNQREALDLKKEVTEELKILEKSSVKNSQLSGHIRQDTVPKQLFMPMPQAQVTPQMAH